MWPFSKQSSELPLEIERQFEKLHRLLQDDSEQISQYPNELRSRILNGLNLDKLPDATGSFGTTITNPIPVNGPIGQLLYLSSLRFGEQRLLFHRLRSIDTIDVYECVSQNGRHWNVLFMDMYHPRKSRAVPDGYTIVQNTLLSGIAQPTPAFPSQLYEAIVSYSKNRFGMSLAAPELRSALEQGSFLPPIHHAKRISRIMQNQLGVSRQELVEELTGETIGCQTKLHDQLKKFSEVGLKYEDICAMELMYFSLSLTTYSIFRWSKKHPVVEVSDNISLKVLKMNSEAAVNAMTVSELAKQYQDRHRSYQTALMLMSGSASSQNEFALLLSRNIVGKRNLVIGGALCAAVPMILSAMKGTIEELELG